MDITIRTATTAETPENLLHDLRTLVSDAELMLNLPPEKGGSASFSDLLERFEVARQQLSALYNCTKDTLTAGVKCTDKTIRTHPYQSLAIAFGAGCLLGTLLKKRGG